MMRGPVKMALAVREPEGGIFLKQEDTPGQTRGKLWRMPVFRGMAAFVDNMAIGMRMLMKSAEVLGLEEEETKFEKAVAKKTGKSVMDIAMMVAVVVALAAGIFMFILLPSMIGQWLSTVIENRLLLNILEGAARLCIFLVYLALVSWQKDIKRVYQYHGAEHKVVTCYESGDALDVEHAMRYTTKHRRCGTSFLLLVMLISILVFSLVGWTTIWWQRTMIRLVLLPVVAGIAYEFIRWAGKSDSKIVVLLSQPGLWLQGMTTRQPTADMVEVALAAFVAALPEDDPSYPKTPKAVGDTQADGDATAPAVPEAIPDGQG